MNKSEALQAMKEGHKVSREYFSSDEYIFINDMGHIMSEDGIPFEDWWVNIEPKIGKSSEDCWSIFRGDINEK